MRVSAAGEGNIEEGIADNNDCPVWGAADTIDTPVITASKAMAVVSPPREC